jgi:hypothetical protein
LSRPAPRLTTLPARLGHLGLRVEPFTAEDALLATEIFARDHRRVLSLDLGVEVLPFR